MINPRGRIEVVETPVTGVGQFAYRFGRQMKDRAQE
jgi:hypothetical protein